MNAARLGVLLGADSLLGRRSGVGRMTLQIARALRGHPAVGALSLMLGSRAASPELLDRLGDEAETLSPAADPARLAALSARVAGLPGLPALRGVWTRRAMNRAAALASRDGRAVVYHETNMIARPFDGMSVVTVNDLSWRFAEGLHPAHRVAWIERRLPRSLAQAARLVAISDFTAREMVAQLGVDRRRIDVVPLAPSGVFRPMPPPDAAAALARLGLIRRGFVLSVSTLEPRKNFDRLLAAHARLPAAVRVRHPLAIAGGRGWGQALAGAAAEQAAREGSLRLLGHVSDAELAVLYGSCTVFAYPSLYEGFGLPVLEAMACGAPVVASGTTATGETAGDAALLIDPFDEAEIAEAIARAIEDEALAARLRAAGLARAAGFTWQRTVDSLMATWRRALAGG
jgi:glycosyltransferase involved in cell wall biosynthesis